MKVDIYNTDKKYKIIYADPPWTYRVWSKETGLKRSAQSHYRTMNKEELQKMKDVIQKISDKDSVLLMWVTSPCLEEGLELIKEWGYTYKTIAFSWVKQNKKSDSLFWGMGYYTRANVELCLLATKGKSLQRNSRAVHQVIMSKIREHSRKPDEARDKIVELFGDISRIELFARQKVDGWDCWGNEVE